jgi:mannose-6-phosphate isomerase-like protein (cupin superfamily)
MEYFFGENCYITEMLNTEADPDVSVARVRVLPGVTTRWHLLNGITERYLILAGTGRAEVGDDAPIVVLPGERVNIPPGIRQRITNIGEGDLIFLAVCTPRFEVEKYLEV